MLGPCFLTPKTDPATCKHTLDQQFAWFARDDTVKSGQVYCVVCMACDTVVFVGETAATRAFAKMRKDREKTR